MERPQRDKDKCKRRFQVNASEFFKPWGTKDKKRLLKAIKQYGENVRGVNEYVWTKTDDEILFAFKRYKNMCKKIYISQCMRETPHILEWINMSRKVLYSSKLDVSAIINGKSLLGNFFNNVCNHLNYDKNQSMVNDIYDFGNIYKFINNVINNEQIGELTPYESLIILSIIQDIENEAYNFKFICPQLVSRAKNMRKCFGIYPRYFMTNSQEVIRYALQKKIHGSRGLQPPYIDVNLDKTEMTEQDIALALKDMIDPYKPKPESELDLFKKLCDLNNNDDIDDTGLAISIGPNDNQFQNEVMDTQAYINGDQPVKDVEIEEDVAIVEPLSLKSLNMVKTYERKYRTNKNSLDASSPSPMSLQNHLKNSTKSSLVFDNSSISHVFDEISSTETPDILLNSHHLCDISFGATDNNYLDDTKPLLHDTDDQRAAAANHKPHHLSLGRKISPNIGYSPIRSFSSSNATANIARTAPASALTISKTDLKRRNFDSVFTFIRSFLPQFYELPKALATERFGKFELPVVRNLSFVDRDRVTNVKNALIYVMNPFCLPSLDEATSILEERERQQHLRRRECQFPTAGGINGLVCPQSPNETTSRMESAVLTSPTIYKTLDCLGSPSCNATSSLNEGFMTTTAVPFKTPIKTSPSGSDVSNGTAAADTETPQTSPTRPDRGVKNLSNTNLSAETEAMTLPVVAKIEMFDEKTPLTTLPINSSLFYHADNRHSLVNPDNFDQLVRSLDDILDKLASRLNKSPAPGGEVPPTATDKERLLLGLAKQKFDSIIPTSIRPKIERNKQEEDIVIIESPKKLGDSFTLKAPLQPLAKVVAAPAYSNGLLAQGGPKVDSKYRPEKHQSPLSKRIKREIVYNDPVYQKQLQPRNQVQSHQNKKITLPAIQLDLEVGEDDNETTNIVTASCYKSQKLGTKTSIADSQKLKSAADIVNEDIVLDTKQDGGRRITRSSTIQISPPSKS